MITHNDGMKLPTHGADSNTNQPPSYPGQPLLQPGPTIGYNVYHTHDQPAPAYQHHPHIPPNYHPHPQQPQQQQQSVVVVSSGTSAAAPIESYCGYQAFACVVFWCCNILFGFIAWILALVADSTKFTDRGHARQLGQASLGMSISGIIVTLVIVAVIVGLILSGHAHYVVPTSTKFCYNGFGCYR